MIKIISSLLLFILTATLVCGEGLRRESFARQQIRDDIVYIINEDIPYTGIIIDCRGFDVPYVNGKTNGVVKTFFNNGQPQNEATYVDGKINGVVKEWSTADGKLWGEYTYVAGELNGLVRFHYKNGQLSCEYNCVAGKENGIKREWYENGQKKSEATYKEGKLVGAMEEWYENGSPKLK